jgi:DNA polymerase IIIc chi subunit
VSAVQNFLKREEKEQGKSYSVEEKRELLQTMENKSKREVEQILTALSPESTLPHETERKVTPTQTELRILLSDEAMKNLEKAQVLLSHQTHGSKSQVIELLIQIALEKIDPAKKEERAQKRAKARQKPGKSK